MKLFITTLTILYCFTFVANAGCWEDPTECTDDSLCREATLPTYNSEGLKLWASLEAPDHVKEALSRELTCAAEPYVLSQTHTDETYIPPVVEPLMSQEKYNGLSKLAKAIIEEQKKDCKEFDGEDAKSEVYDKAVYFLTVGINDDQNQTLTKVEVVDFSGLHCSGSAGYCGSAGCLHKLLVNGSTKFNGYIRVLKEAQLKNGENVLLTQLHGSACGSYGADTCDKYWRWDGNRLLFIEK